jgi:predicted GIY-YIG superfamily endonuclease
MTRHKFPVRTALYRLYDAESNLIYVGVSYQPRYRLTQHKQKKVWWPEVARVEIHWYPDRRPAEDIERDAIRAEAPRYNTVHHPVHGVAWAAAQIESRRRIEARKAAENAERESA